MTAFVKRRELLLGLAALPIALSAAGASTVPTSAAGVDLMRLIRQTWIFLGLGIFTM
jgi:hypothetical protein